MIWGVTARQCVVQCVLHVVRAADTVLVCNCTERCVRLQHCPPLQETWVLCVQTYRSSFRLNSTTGNTATVWATCCFNASTSELIKKTTHFFVGQKKFEAADLNTSKQTTWNQQMLCDTRMSLCCSFEPQPSSRVALHVAQCLSEHTRQLLMQPEFVRVVRRQRRSREVDWNHV